MPGRQSETTPLATGRITRRTLLKSALFGTATLGLSGGALGLYTVAVAPFMPVVDRVSIGLPWYPAGAPPLTVVLMSDFHIGPRFTSIDIRRAVEMANSLHPDLAVLTGDFVHHDIGLVFDAAAELGRLHTRFGRFAVLGNHDHWLDPRVVAEALLRNDIELLPNTATRLNADSGLWLAGVDDVWSGKPDLQGALEPVPEKAPVVLLCHEPDFADHVPARVGLQLSGRTHGGQVRIPGKGARVLPFLGTKYQIGLYQAKETMVYVNRGLGVVNPPVRFNCPPEITLLTLGAS